MMTNNEKKKEIYSLNTESQKYTNKLNIQMSKLQRNKEIYSKILREKNLEAKWEKKTSEQAIWSLQQAKLIQIKISARNGDEIQD